MTSKEKSGCGTLVVGSLVKSRPATRPLSKNEAIESLPCLDELGGAGMLLSMNIWIQYDTRRIRKARLLLEPAVAGMSGCWADVGCGDGVFTYLLLELLSSGSEVYAVDKKQSALRRLQQNIIERIPGAAIHTIHADFTQSLSLPPLDGLVLANSLHFVRHKAPVLKQLVTLLKPGGRIVVIEYNTSRGNSAVPYPLDETGFLHLARETGLRHPRLVTRAPSSFLGEMYTGTGQVSSVEDV